MMICLAVCERVDIQTDGAQTDRQTPRHRIGRAMHSVARQKPLGNLWTLAYSAAQTV